MPGTRQDECCGFLPNAGPNDGNVLFGVVNMKYIIRILACLILLDLVATSVWYGVYGVPEQNPVMAFFISKSILLFAVTKLFLSVPGLYILSAHSGHWLTKVGLVFLVTSYVEVSLVHAYLFNELIL